MDGVLVMSNSIFKAERYSQAPFAASVNMGLGRLCFFPRTK